MVHEGSLLMGFSRSLYFSSSTKSITNIIDANGRLNKEESPLSYTLPSNALLGNILLAGKGVNFIPFNHTLLYGKSTTSLNEIVISSAMAKKLFGKENVVDKELHLAFENNRIDKETFYDYEYQTISLKIKGVVSSSKYAIYHSYMWPISFFRDELNVSSFSLLVNTVAFSLLDKTLSSSIIDELSSTFPSFSFSNPMKEINDTVDKVCSYAEYGLLLFSFIAIIVSFLLSMMVIYLFTYENRKEIGVFRYIGLSISQTRKSFISFGIAIAISSFLLSAIQLVFISIIINLYFNVTFNLVTFLSSLIKPFILMVIS